MITIKELKCLNCGHKWLSQMDRPKTCPRCKSYKWDHKPKPSNAEGITGIVYNN